MKDENNIIKEKKKWILSFYFLYIRSINTISIDDKETDNSIIDYYDAVRVAYQNSRDVMEYLNCSTIEDINKDLKKLEIYLQNTVFLKKG